MTDDLRRLCQDVLDGRGLTLEEVVDLVEHTLRLLDVEEAAQALTERRYGDIRARDFYRLREALAAFRAGADTNRQTSEEHDAKGSDEFGI